MTAGAEDTNRIVEQAARESYGLLLAYLASRSGDLAAAEDALSEAFAAALAQWPRHGIPDNPAAWLLEIARRRQSDFFRRQKTRTRSKEHLMLVSEEIQAAAEDVGSIPDRRLALMFACADPDINDSSVITPLILQTVLGFSAAEIAPAFLTSPATMSQRLVRAKTRIREAGIAFRIPGIEEIGHRLSAVLAAIYTVYGKGWSVTSESGGSPFSEEAIWLGRLVVSLLPDEPEPKGMLALMLFSEARRAARRDPAGAFVAFEDQDTGRWDRAQIEMAENLLAAANREPATGRYQVEAAIQSAHITRRMHDLANWSEIRALYDVLLALSPTPVVMLNRAVALLHLDGPEAALDEIAPLAADKAMTAYQPYWATRGLLCALAQRRDDAWEALTLAIGLTTDPAERLHLQQRRDRIKN